MKCYTQNASQDAYGGQSVVITPTACPQHSELPFTGFDVGLVGTLGLLLVCGGLAVRNAATKRG